MLKLSVLLFAVIAIGEIDCGYFSWTDCGDPSTRTVEHERLTLTPDPLLFGRLVNIGGTFNILRTLPEDAMISLELWRSFSFFGYPFDMRMPCVFGGDCKVNAYRLIQGWHVMCDFVRQAQNGTCYKLLTPGKYSADGITERIPALNPLMTTFAAGTYRARVKVFDNAEKELACMFATGAVYAPPDEGSEGSTAANNTIVNEIQI
ncbi:hypothetical protein HDE_00702 [Halotydeus destructor]|nr:hypothetical protein HDE_00702 [Halotydeus destructor]